MGAYATFSSLLVPVRHGAYPSKWPNRFRDSWERLLQFNKDRKFHMYQDEVMVPMGDWAERRLKNLSRTESRARPSGYDLVKTLLGAHLSSQEETIFGEFLEGLAIFSCGHVYGGSKSSAEGIDLELDRTVSQSLFFHLVPFSGRAVAFSTSAIRLGRPIRILWFQEATLM